MNLGVTQVAGPPGWRGGWRDGWRYGWRDGWRDGWREGVFEVVFTVGMLWQAAVVSAAGKLFLLLHLQKRLFPHTPYSTSTLPPLHL